MTFEMFNKLAKARKKFGPGKLWVKKVWDQNISIDFLAEVDHFKIFFVL